MIYMGSKSRIAKHITPIIQDYIDKNPKKVYIEPFVGGANVIDKIKCECRMGFDVNKYLIALLQHVQSGGDLPEVITREDHTKARIHKDDYPPWYVGCVGFVASYRGKFFAGYAGAANTKSGAIRNYYKDARKNLLHQAPALSGVTLECRDYKESTMGLENCVIYCDPPYADTTGYSSKGFNHPEFWEVMRHLSRKNTVLISEQTAPEDFKCIWECQVVRTMSTITRSPATEKLFKFEG